MKNIQYMLLAAALGCMVSNGAMAQSAGVNPPSAQVGSGQKWSSDALVGDLLDFEPAKAVLIKHMPDLIQDGQIEMVRGLSFRSLQQFSPEVLTDALLEKIDADLAKLPPQIVKPAGK